MCEVCAYAMFGMCRYEGHDYGRDRRNANCRSCGETDGPLLSYIGRVSKVQKRTGLSFDDAERLMTLRSIARDLVRGKLSDRVGLAGLTEADV